MLSSLDSFINREKKQQNVFDLVRAVHESESSTLNSQLNPAHRFEVTLEPDNFTEEKFELFRNYQVNVHHEPEPSVSKRGFEGAALPARADECSVETFGAGAGMFECVLGRCCGVR